MTYSSSKPAKGFHPRAGSWGETRHLLTVALLLLALRAGPALADEPVVSLTLSPAQVAEMVRLIDLQPISQAPPPAFWDLQTTIGKALQANPDAARAFLLARSAAR